MAKHGGPRLYTDEERKIRNRESQRRYREKHIDVIRERGRIYAAEVRAERPNEIRQRVKESWHKHKDVYLNRYKNRYEYKPEMNKSSKRALRYGISAETYKDMLLNQSNACKICGYIPEEGGRALAIDHCHNTNKVRGLLCTTCNIGLGDFKDDPKLLIAAANYILETV